MSVLTTRDKSIDFIKGIAIYLVVLGHCWSISKDLFQFIYSFHMPLFFCISGYLFSSKKKYGDFLIAKFKTLIIPYILFFIFSFIISVSLLDREVTILQGLEYMIKGGKHCIYVCNWPLWYLPLFFLVSNILYFISKIKITAIRYIFLITSFLLSVPIQNYCNETIIGNFVPFALNSLCPALFFMLFAMEFRIIKNKVAPKIDKKTKRIATPILSAGLFVIGLLLAAGNSEQIVNIKSYTFMIYSLLMIQFIALICQGCENKYITYIGNNSLIILGFHRILIYVLREYFEVEKLLNHLHISKFAEAFLVSCVCILLICGTKELICSVVKCCKKHLYIKSKVL